MFSYHHQVLTCFQNCRLVWKFCRGLAILVLVFTNENLLMIFQGFCEESENVNSKFWFAPYSIESIKVVYLMFFYFSVLTSDKHTTDEHQRSSSGKMLYNYYEIRY